MPCLRVLLVEDEPDLRAAVRDTLIHAGHTCEEASEGRLVAALLAGSRFDVMVLDVLLADGRIDPLLDQLSESGLPATVLTSADATDRTRLLAERHGLRLILKPFDLDELITAIERAAAD